VPHLATVAESVWEGRQARIEYERNDGSVTRVLGPLGLVLKGGVWYLVALSDGQVRTYRVSRIADAVVLEERTERPAGFDLATFWTESSAAFERDTPRVDVVVRLPRTRLERLGDAVGWHAIETAETLDEPEPDWVRLRLDLSWPEEVPSRILSAGSSVEVLEPFEIRERVIATARRIVERYEPVEIRGVAAPPQEAEAIPAPRLTPADASATGG
jgi:predicted DNA-binding transcriptional regulator YafY